MEPLKEELPKLRETVEEFVKIEEDKDSNLNKLLGTQKEAEKGLEDTRKRVPEAKQQIMETQIAHAKLKKSLGRKKKKSQNVARLKQVVRDKAVGLNDEHHIDLNEGVARGRRNSLLKDRGRMTLLSSPLFFCLSRRSFFGSILPTASTYTILHRIVKMKKKRGWKREMYYVDLDETVAKLKARIQEKTNIKRPCQKLFLKKRASFRKVEESKKEDGDETILENTKKLSEYSFGMPATVLLEKCVDSRLAMKGVDISKEEEKAVGEMSRAELLCNECKKTIEKLISEQK